MPRTIVESTLTSNARSLTDFPISPVERISIGNGLLSYASSRTAHTLERANSSQRLTRGATESTACQSISSPKEPRKHLQVVLFSCVSSMHRLLMHACIIDRRLAAGSGHVCGALALPSDSARRHLDSLKSGAAKKEMSLGTRFRQARLGEVRAFRGPSPQLITLCDSGQTTTKKMLGSCRGLVGCALI